MSSYLPEKTFAVCSSQSTSGPLPLLATREGTVNYASQSVLFLTIVDRKLDGQYSCKTKWSSGAGTAAFGVGIMAGLAIAATVATVPVVGWIVGGAIAIGCIAYGLFKMFGPKPTCSEMIGFQESSWKNQHPMVRFDKIPAVTKKSFIMCKEGGILIPFLSESAAIEASKSVANKNKVEIGLVGLASLLGGTAFGFTLGTGGLLSAGKDFALGFLGSYAVFQPLEHIEKQVIRGIVDEDENNLYYDQILEEINGESSQFDSIDDSYNPIGVLEGLQEIKANAIEAGATSAQINEINAAIAEAEKLGSYARNINPSAQRVFDNARNGVYGEQVRNNFTNRAGNGRGMNQGGNYEASAQNRQSELNRQNRQLTTSKAMNAINMATLVLPFITTGLSEATLKSLTNAGSDEDANGLNVNAQQH